MQLSKLAKLAWPLLILSVIILYFYGLGRIPFVGPDEPRYAEVAREMFLRGDFITPTLGNHAWFEKPALLYWMMMLSFRAFGISEWSARIAPALSGLLTAFLVYWLTLRVERKEKEMLGLSRWSFAALVSMLGLIVFSRGASFDILLTMTVTAALACFFAFEIEEDGKNQSWLLAGFYASIGLSLLAKGLAGIVLPFGIVFTYFLLQRSLPKRKIILSLLWGVPLMLAVSAIWYGPVIARHGWTFVDQFFIQHHFARYLSNKYHHPQPFYFYLPIIMMLTLPWTLFLIDALIQARHWRWRGTTSVESKLRLFALAWLTLPVLFFSLSQSKLPGYILPALPGAGLILGERLKNFTRAEKSWALKATGVLLVSSGSAVIIYAARTGNVTITCALFISLPVILVGLFAIFNNRRPQAAALIVAATLVSSAITISCGVEKVARRASARELIEAANALGYSSTPIHCLYAPERSAEFYAVERLAYDANGELVWFDGLDKIKDVARQSAGPVLVFVPHGRVGKLTSYWEVQTEIIGDNGAVALAIVRTRG